MPLALQYRHIALYGACMLYPVVLKRSIINKNRLELQLHATASNAKSEMIRYLSLDFDSFDGFLEFDNFGTFHPPN